MGYLEVKQQGGGAAAREGSDNGKSPYGNIHGHELSKTVLKFHLILKNKMF